MRGLVVEDVGNMFTSILRANTLLDFKELTPSSNFALDMTAIA